MNKWFRRAVGTVGIAGGALLLGTGTAQADDAVAPAEDPQLLQGLFEGLAAPAVDAPTHAPGLAADGPGQSHVAVGNGSVPDVFRALPITDAVPADGLGLPAPGAAQESGLGLPPALLDGLPTGRLVGGLPIGGLLGGGLPTGGLGLPTGGLGLPTGGLGLPTGGLGLPTGDARSRDAAGPATSTMSGGAVHVLPPAQASEALPLGGLPILDEVLANRLLSGRGGPTTFGGGRHAKTGIPAERPAVTDPEGATELLGGLPLPLGGLPLGALPLPLGALPLGGLPLGGLPLGGLPLGELPVGELPVGDGTGGAAGGYAGPSDTSYVPRHAAH